MPREDWRLRAAAEERRARVARERCEAEDDARRDAARQAFAMSRKAWVDAHGSPALQRALREGYGCTETYLAERAAAELPEPDGEPRWARFEHDDFVGELRDPSDVDFASLDAVRAALPEDTWTVRLAWYHGCASIIVTPTWAPRESWHMPSDALDRDE